MSALPCSTSLVEETLLTLRAAGRHGKECVALWLSPRPLLTGLAVTEVYVPEQVAEVDYFRIPPAAMTTLMKRLRERRFAIAAQVHSHPHEAFHSRADDEWAIIRHCGALSIVVPNFAAETNAKNFLNTSAVFELSADDKWVEVIREKLEDRLRLI